MRAVIMDVLWDAETAPIEWLQGLADWPVLPLTAVTGLGAQAVVIPLLALVFWCVSPGLGGRLLVLAISSSVVNHLLKLFVHGSRPSWYSAQIAQHTSESSFGMPSGHAQGATAVLGYAGIRSGRRGLLWAALALAALICFSRVYLGAHFISDVVVGVLLGALILWAFLRWEDRVLAWWRGLPTARWASLAVAAALVPCVLAALWRYTARGDWTVPAEWIGAVPPDPAGYTLSGVYSTSGALLAVLVGLTLLDRRGWYSARGRIGARAARFVLGLSVVLCIEVLSRLLSGPLTGMADAVASFAASGAILFWITFGAPELFVRSGLAERPGTPPGQGGHARDRLDDLPGA
ncbi:phosphatase PAP2 family protein [Nocardiopsis changdeensis]|uniref:phosphatase PAP2 family protein n=1 Tax=Nocardiopsis changdeensis TaxID=2831969 RepID=UPI003F4513D2